MAIQPPGARLLRQIPLRFVTVAGRGRKPVDTQIALIPFIDFLMVVVVFLLMSFSATGEMPGPDLPSAEHGTPVEIAPVIAIDESAVTVDGRRVANTRDLTEDATHPRIERLVADLGVQRDNFAVLHPGAEFDGSVLVLAARGTDYRVLRSVLSSAAQAGYGNVQLAVRDGVL